ncbi:MAG: TVP38/TMEM64 family protein [Thermodesulfobacteriota bacterium]
MTDLVKKILIIFVVLVAAFVFWQILAYNNIVTPEKIENFADWEIFGEKSFLSFLIIVLVYSLSMLLMFPLTVLVVATALIFGPVWGFFYAAAGTLSSSAVSYYFGRYFGREALLRHGGARLNKVSAYISGKGIFVMAMINLFPVAPFTMTNMLAGASHMRFADYFIGSAIGILPGLAAVTLIGSQLGALIFSEREQSWIVSFFAVLAGAGILIFLRYLAMKFFRKRD